MNPFDAARGGIDPTTINLLKNDKAVQKEMAKRTQIQ
jgi:hypothetical protein